MLNAKLHIARNQGEAAAKAGMTRNPKADNNFIRLTSNLGYNNALKLGEAWLKGFASVYNTETEYDKGWNAASQDSGSELEAYQFELEYCDNSAYGVESHLDFASGYVDWCEENGLTD